jgi:hypothetical protein
VAPGPWGPRSAATCVVCGEAATGSAHREFDSGAASYAALDAGTRLRDKCGHALLRPPGCRLRRSAGFSCRQGCPSPSHRSPGPAAAAGQSLPEPVPQLPRAISRGVQGSSGLALPCKQCHAAGSTTAAPSDAQALHFSTARSGHAAVDPLRASELSCSPSKPVLVQCIASEGGGPVEGLSASAAALYAEASAGGCWRRLLRVRQCTAGPDDAPPALPSTVPPRRAARIVTLAPGAPAHSLPPPSPPLLAAPPPSPLSGMQALQAWAPRSTCWQWARRSWPMALSAAPLG